MASPARAYEEPPLPTIEQIAALTPIRDPEGRPIHDVCVELNAALARAGLLFEESAFSEVLASTPDPEQGRFTDYRWILCAAVPGSCEGIYIHLHLIARDGGNRLIALGKSYKRPNALAIVAATTRLLGL